MSTEPNTGSKRVFGIVVKLNSVIPEYGRSGTNTTVDEFLFARNEETGELSHAAINKLKSVDLSSHTGKDIVNSALESAKQRTH